MATRKYYNAFAQKAYFDEEEGTPPPATEGEEGTPPPAEGDKSGKVFTQAEVDKLMANHRKTLQEDVKKKADALRDAQSSLSLTQEEKDKLSGQINDLENSLLTQKEISARERDRLQKEKETELKKVTDEANFWKTRHHNTLIENELVKAASIDGQKAINPAQIVSLFGKDAVVNDVDGNLVVQVKVKAVSSDGTVKVLTLDPQQAIKEYSTRNEYYNLFEMPGKDGMGRPKPNFTGKDGAVPSSFAEYKASRMGNAS